MQKDQAKIRVAIYTDEVNPWILKEFLLHFVSRIYVDRGTISSVTFKNDLTLHFIISNPVKNYTDF